MPFLKKVLSILIYEKEKLLNSILQYQISNYYNCKIFIVDNYKELIPIACEKKIDISVLNLNNLNKELKNLVDFYQNKNINIIGYHKVDLKNKIGDTKNLFILEKPFKIVNLLNHLNSIINSDITDNSNKHLMSHIIFSPSKKIISNSQTRITEHLTEKENNLLIYFYNKKNIEILKKDLLTNIWGVSDEINTHTLETHIYRLKQKLYKLDPNLSFSLVNKQGLYCLKYNDYLDS